MNNQTIGAQIDRLAAVNDLLLKQEKQKCLDYKYDKMVAEMKNTSWDSEMASGSEWPMPNCYVTLVILNNIYSYRLQQSNGHIKLAPSSAFIKRQRKKVAFLVIVSMCSFSSSNARTSMAKSMWIMDLHARLAIHNLNLLFISGTTRTS